MNKAFTLVELLVVISIIGILVSIVAGGFRSSQARSRDAQRKSDLRQIANSLELYFSDHNNYPNEPLPWGAEFTDGNTVYFKQLPDDPVSAQDYYYRVFDGNQKFQLFAKLENGQDKDLISLPYNNCGGTCNFSITSTNTTPHEQ